jgi:copper transport protein
VIDLRLRHGGLAAACAATLALILAVAVVSPALAHAELVTSSPGAGEVVAEPPAELVLLFNEPLESGFSAVDVADAAGVSVVADAGTVDASDDHQLHVELPPLEDGVYTVTWRSLSAADGHDASGFFSFGVGDVTQPVPGGGGRHGSGDRDWLGAAGRWVGYLGLLAGLGLPVIAVTVLRRRLRTDALRAVAGLMALSGAAVLVMLLWSAVSTAQGDLPGYVLGSRNGSLQLARAAVMIAGAVAVWVLAGRMPVRALAAAAAVGMGAAILLAASGHAAGLAGLAPILGQVVHVAAVAVWLTGVASLLVCVARPGWLAAHQPPMQVLVPRFSSMAIASIGLVVVSGLYASWSLTGTLLDFGTPYGQVLLVKLGLAVVALAIGALNYFDGGRGMQLVAGFRARLVAEVSTAAAILVASALLSTTPPLEGARGVAIQPVPDAFGNVLPGMRLELSPGRPGVNRISVTAVGALGTAPMELALDSLDGGTRTRIALRHIGGPSMPDMPGMEHGAGDSGEDQEDQWVADALVLPAGSSWNASVRILNQPGGSEVSRQRYAFAMGDNAVAQGLLGGRLNMGLGFAALLLVGGSGGIGLGIGRMRLPRCDATASRIALIGGGTAGIVLGLAIGAQWILT